MEKHMWLLGFKAKDVVTGFSGVVTSISFDLYGCVMALLTPPADVKTGKREESQWFDTKRLQVTNEKPVMATPTFAAPAGPESKPAMPSSPTY